MECEARNRISWRKSPRNSLSSRSDVLLSGIIIMNFMDTHNSRERTCMNKPNRQRDLCGCRKRKFPVSVFCDRSFVLRSLSSSCALGGRRKKAGSMVTNLVIMHFRFLVFSSQGNRKCEKWISTCIAAVKLVSGWLHIGGCGAFKYS